MTVAPGADRVSSPAVSRDLFPPPPRSHHPGGSRWVGREYTPTSRARRSGYGPYYAFSSNWANRWRHHY